MDNTLLISSSFLLPGETSTIAFSMRVRVRVRVRVSSLLCSIQHVYACVMTTSIQHVCARENKTAVHTYVCL